MTNEHLCALALAAIDDADAMSVFCDAREEGAITGLDCDGAWLDELGWARAVAAEILFRDWPTSWPLAQKCRAPLYPAAFLHDALGYAVSRDGRLLGRGSGKARGSRR